MLDTLRRFCEEVGNDVLLVQGPGANISAKGPDGMLIKASGCTLRTMIETRGYVLMDPVPLASAYSRGQLTEDQARVITTQSIIAEQKRPSMEAGFHSYMAKYVIHTHPIYLNAILCSDSAQRLATTLFPDALFIPYARPGHELSQLIAEKYSTDKAVILLQNHGLIISANSADECIELTRLITLKSEQYIIETTKTWAEQYREPVAHSHNGIQGFLSSYQPPGEEFLFPDAAVFLSDISVKTSIVNGKVFYPLSQEASIDIDEVLYAHHLLNYLINKLGEPNPLTQQQVQAITNMEEEKARKALVK